MHSVRYAVGSAVVSPRHDYAVGSTDDSPKRDSAVGSTHVS
jgi:hypothetical protein